MAITAFVRGWPIIFISGQWVYEDTHSPVELFRVCKKCGHKPTAEGFDACLGKISGVSSACCGHGSAEPITLGGTT